MESSDAHHPESVPWRQNGVLESVRPAVLDAVAPFVTIRTVEAGEDILREGDPSPDFYLVEEGLVEVLTGSVEAQVAILGPGDNFGLTGVIDRALRSATVRAIERSRLAVVPADALNVVEERWPGSLRGPLLTNYVRFQNERLRLSNRHSAAVMGQLLKERETVFRHVSQMLHEQNASLREANEETVRLLQQQFAEADQPEGLEQAPAASDEVPWRRNSMFSGLSRGVLERMSSMMRPVSLDAGTIVVREGEPGAEAYLIERGELEVYHEKDGIRLATLGPGNDFGMMALIDRAPRSATVRTLTPASLVSFSLPVLDELPAEDRQRVLTALLSNNLRQQNKRLRRANETTVDALRRQLSESKALVAMGRFVTWTTLIICLYGFMLRVTSTLATSTAVRTTIMVGFALLFAGVTYFVLKRSGYPMADYGLHITGWRRSFLHALGWTAGFLTVATVAKEIWLALSPEFSHEPLFAFPYANESDVGAILVDGTVYAIIAPLQEFVARSGLQGSLQKFLTGRYVKTRAVVVASVLFITTHLHISTSFALLSLIPSLFWGALFARNNSLPAVGLSHILIGLWFIYVLGFPGLN